MFTKSLLLLIHFPLILNACISTRPTTVKQADITLIFQKRDYTKDTVFAQNGSFMVNSNPIITYYLANDFTTFSIKPDNNFKTDTIYLKNVDSLMLKHYYNFNLFTYCKLSKGDTVLVKYDGDIPYFSRNSDESYYSDNLEVLHYVNNKDLYDRLYDTKNKRYSITSSDYAKLTKHKISYLDNLSSENKITEKEYNRLKYLFELRIEMETNKTFDFRLVSDAEINNPTYRNYLPFIFYYGFRLKNIAFGSRKGLDFAAGLDSILAISEKLPSKSQYYLLEYAMEQIKKTNSAKDFYYHFKKYDQICQDSSILQGFKKRNFLLFKSLENKSESFQFLNKFKENTSFNEAINLSNSEVIYLDFWASWCAPCIKELPYSNELKRLYENKQITFLYLSIDEDFDKWLLAAERYNILSNSYINIPSKNSIDVTFKVSTIPRYMIFDKSGNIINADAPRPSDPKLKELFDELLK